MKQTQPTFARTVVLELRPVGSAAGALPPIDELPALLDSTGHAFVATGGRVVFAGLDTEVFVSESSLRFEAMLADGYLDEEHGEWRGEDADADEANAPIYEAVEEAGVQLQRRLRWLATTDLRGGCDVIGECPGCETEIFAWEEDEDACALCGDALWPDDEDDDAGAVKEVDQRRSCLVRLRGTALDKAVSERVGEAIVRGGKGRRGGTVDGAAFWLLPIRAGYDLRIELGATELVVWLFLPRKAKELPDGVFDRAHDLVTRLHRLTRWQVRECAWFFRSDFGKTTHPCPACGAARFAHERACFACHAALPAPREAHTIRVARALLLALLAADEIEVNDRSAVVKALADAFEDPTTTAASLLEAVEKLEATEEIFVDEEALAARVVQAKRSVT